MRKFIAILISVIFVAGIALAVAWPYLKMEFASSAYYTRQDKRKYDYYTPELLKKMPRISDRYEFEYGNVTGPQAHVFSVRFYGATETQNIHQYLVSAGYQLQPSCDVEAECWRTQRSKEVVTVIKYTLPDSIVVQLYQSPDTE